MKIVRPTIVLSVLIPLPVVAQKNLNLSDLPQAVQTSIRKEVGKLPISSIRKETEGRKVEWEVETTYNGAPRSYTFAANGHLEETEDTVGIDSIPAPAKATIQSKAVGGSIQTVERVTSGGKVSYEADVTTKAGKKIEVGVTGGGKVKGTEKADND